MSDVPGINTAILDFCTRLDDGPRDDGPRPLPPPRDPADYAWLREVISAVEYPERKTKRLLDLVCPLAAGEEAYSTKAAAARAAAKVKAAKPAADAKKASDEQVDAAEAAAEDVILALEELCDMSEDINIATEVSLMNGPRRILKLLTRHRIVADDEDEDRVANSATIRALCGTTIAYLSQNHDKLQADFIANKWEATVLPMISEEVDNAARSALLFAVNSLCRGCDEATGTFIGKSGLALLLQVLTKHAADGKSVIRCLRFAEYLAYAKRVSAEALALAACGFVTDDRDTVAESAATAVKEILEQCEASRDAGGAALAEKLQDRLAQWKKAVDAEAAGVGQQALIAMLY
jgi:hypothetical protein